SWHQTGMVYQSAERPEAAEDAYRESLAISARLGDVAGQAHTLVQLGNLYDDVLGRPEQAVAFYSQAADKYVELGDETSEALARSNLGETFRKLRRLEEARHEVLRAIECRERIGHASSIWSSWSILADIETDSRNPPAAVEAERQAIECYLAYRRDGGENHTSDGCTCLPVTQALRAGDPRAAASLLQQRAGDPNL